MIAPRRPSRVGGMLTMQSAELALLLRASKGQVARLT
jgi:hypothetical protein